ncbi:hypothetical protein [Myroides odoratus]|uniref:Uncharacterized protein n=2 Tax=Myroides odoratus TaxID=256 RepID=A0A378RPL9_MYROD|nr:hypothetical protein [Myroides odoratus]QQU04943.1 hypothetical protein I6I89_06555 [Myroides odoratus]STZ27590.1 Uncharacterised protein [Myroides odoratus]
MYKTLLTITCALCLLPLGVLGQKKFKDTHQLLWVKSLPSSDAITGFNFNSPLPFSG